MRRRIDIIHFRTTVALGQWIRTHAKKQGVSVSEYLRRLVKDDIARQEGPL